MSQPEFSTQEECPPDLIGGPALRIIAMPKDANPSGDIFGGWIMSMIDLAGGRVAFDEARGRIATVAVEGMSFVSPVRIGDEVSFFADLLGIGRTSIRVRVTAWVRRGPQREAHKVTEATVTYVAMDDDGRPRPVKSEEGDAR